MRDNLKTLKSLFKPFAGVCTSSRGVDNIFLSLSTLVYESKFKGHIQICLSITVS